MIDGRNVFDQPINSMNKTCENIRKIATGKGDDYTTGCLLDYSYFKENFKMIAIDLSRQNELDADPRAVQQIKPLTTSNNTLNPRLSYNDTKIKVLFTGSCLKQPKFTFTHKKVVNIYIVYELCASSSHSSDPTIKNCLFGAVTLIKNSDI